MPQYMLLIVDDPTREWDSPEAPGQQMQKMGVFAGELARQGKIAGGGPLTGIADAARVRLAPGGSPVVTDGPFAETKEMLAGYFVLEVADRAEAVEIAKRCPHLEVGTVEVREMIHMGPPA
jgi:hypothetical protein